MLSPQILLRTRVDTLAKRSLAMCIFPRLADTPTSYVFSELLLVHMTACVCCDWLDKRSCHFFNQSEVKPKPMVICWHVFSGAWCQVPEFSLSPDWLVWLSVHIVIGQGENRTLFQLVRRKSSHMLKNSYFCHVAPTRMLIHVLPICKKHESQH